MRILYVTILAMLYFLIFFHMQVLSLFFVLFFVIGCSGQINNSFDQESLNNKSKGLVIMRATGTLHGSKEFFVTTGWLNTNTQNMFHTRGPNKRFLNITDDPTKYYIYMLEPGHYTLNEIFFLEQSSVDMFSIHGYSNISNFAYFDIKGGEVLYLGDCYQNYDSKKDGSHGMVLNRTGLNDTFERAKEFMRQNYPSVADKLEKKLILTYNANEDK